MIVYIDKQPTIFLNGRAVHTGFASPREIVYAPFQFGGMAYGHFEGLMDEVRIYNRALSAAEIKKLAPRPRAWSPIPADGVVYLDTWASLSWMPGDFAVSHDVYLGDNFDDLNNGTRNSDVFGGNQTATFYVAGCPGFAYPDGLVPGTTYFWRIDEVNDADPNSPRKGAVWSFSIPPKTAYSPNPADGAEFVDPNAPTLSWTPADSAASHQLYFGTDKETVRNADTSSPEYKGSKALGAESYDPGLLDPDTAYHWRVNEVDDQGNTSIGPRRSFTTGAFLLVDDFAGYTDDDAAGEAIWQTWIDGFGVADNGAQVGYSPPPYAEQTIVHGGVQSMPLLYSNQVGVTNSEAALTLTAPRDWAQAGVAELSLWFRGSSANDAEPLHVGVANSSGTPAVVAHGDANAAQLGTWTQWIIPLQAFADQGINLVNVDKIAIRLGTKAGMSAPGGFGTTFIDEIRLYR